MDLKLKFFATLQGDELISEFKSSSKDPPCAEFAGLAN